MLTEAVEIKHFGRATPENAQKRARPFHILSAATFDGNEKATMLVVKILLPVKANGLLFSSAHPKNLVTLWNGKQCWKLLPHRALGLLAA